MDGEDLLGEPATGARHHPPFEGDGDAIFWEGRNPCPVPMVLASGIRLIARMVHGELLMLIGLSVLWGGCAVGVMAAVVVRHFQLRSCRERQAKNLSHALALVELNRRIGLDKVA